MGRYRIVLLMLSVMYTKSGSGFGTGEQLSVQEKLIQQGNPKLELKANQDGAQLENQDGSPLDGAAMEGNFTASFDIDNLINITALEENYLGNLTERGFLHGLGEGISIILVSEIGDKTFFIAAILAMRNNKLVVFLAAVSALFLMTVLSGLLGWVVTTFIPREVTYYGCTAIMFLFGFKMLWEAWRMSENEADEVQREVEEELARMDDPNYNPEEAMEVEEEPSTRWGRFKAMFSLKKVTSIFKRSPKPDSQTEPTDPETLEPSSRCSEISSNTGNARRSLEYPQEGTEYERRATVTIGSEEGDVDSVFGDVFNGEGDNETMVSTLSSSEPGMLQVLHDPSNRIESDPTAERGDDNVESGDDRCGASSNATRTRPAKAKKAPFLDRVIERNCQENSYVGKKCLKIFKLFLNAFTMTFIAEWGDRSQLATIVLVGINDVGGVIVGGCLGHFICTGTAVVCGAIIARWVSVRKVTFLGALIFIGFAIASIFISPLEDVPVIGGGDNSTLPSNDTWTNATMDEYEIKSSLSTDLSTSSPYSTVGAEPPSNTGLYEMVRDVVNATMYG